MSSETSLPIKSGDIWRHKGSRRIVIVKEIAPSNWPGREGEPVVVYEEVLETGVFECNFRRYYEPAPKAANTYTKLHAEVKQLREALEAIVERYDVEHVLIGLSPRNAPDGELDETLAEQRALFANARAALEGGE